MLIPAGGEGEFVHRVVIHRPETPQKLFSEPGCRLFVRVRPAVVEFQLLQIPQTCGIVRQLNILAHGGQSSASPPFRRFLADCEHEQVADVVVSTE